VDRSRGEPATLLDFMAKAADPKTGVRATPSLSCAQVAAKEQHGARTCAWSAVLSW
jgi:hypothetical protein